MGKFRAKSGQGYGRGWSVFWAEGVRVMAESGQWLSRVRTEGVRQGVGGVFLKNKQKMKQLFRSLNSDFVKTADENVSASVLVFDELLPPAGVEVQHELCSYLLMKDLYFLYLLVTVAKLKQTPDSLISCT